MIQNIILSSRVAFICLVFLMASIGCARNGAVVIENEEGRVIIESKGEGPAYPSEEPYYPGEVLNIPKGHLPPPGKCRIWYPNLPPGQQPPPGDCDNLRYHVPPGAWLIRG
jgi:hypothetical protein